MVKRLARRPAVPNLVEMVHGVFWGYLRFWSIILCYIHHTFSFAQPTGQTPEQILTYNIPQHAESCKVQTFGDKIIKINI